MSLPITRYVPGHRTRFVLFSKGDAALIGGNPGQEGGRHHDQAHMTMPAVPGARLAVIVSEIVLGALEAILNDPAQHV